VVSPPPVRIPSMHGPRFRSNETPPEKLRRG
jgi:hypothetical protein